MQTVTIYTKQTCFFCHNAKDLLKAKNVAFNEIRIDGNEQLRNEMIAKSGRRTVPQIWIGERHIGGCDDLIALDNSGALDGLLKG